jgi:hypothetical protein
MSTFFLLRCGNILVQVRRVFKDSVLKTSCIPLLEISKALHQSIKIDRVRTIKVKLVRVCFGMLLRSQAFVERVLHPILSIPKIHES